MPLYEYKCSDCGRPFEMLVATPALADEIVCRHCGSSSVRRLISTFSARSTGRGEALAAASTAMSGGGCACGGGGCGCGGH